MNTQENNKMIAEFMGLPFMRAFKMRDKETKLYYKVCEIPYPLQRKHLESTYEEINLKYHESWDWLMPVVDKIENYLSDNVGKVGYFDECLSSNNLEIRYNAVVEFINQYNNNESAD